MSLADLIKLSTFSPTRKWLADNHYHNVCGYTDLHRHGYQIRLWVNFVTGDQYYEYLPLVKGNWKTRDKSNSGLPRVCLNSYEDQCRLHRALGLSTCGPRKEWSEMPLLAGVNWD